MLSGYAKLGMIKPARSLFDKMPEKDVVSWNMMVIAYAQSGVCDEALRFYGELRRSKKREEFRKLCKEKHPNKQIHLRAVQREAS